MSNGMRPDFNTDVLWKGPTGRPMMRDRTTSIDSTDSSTMEPNSPSALDGPGRSRRVSFSDMLFGPSTGAPGFFSRSRTTSISEQASPPVGVELNPSGSVVNDARFKELLRHQNRVLGEDGSMGGMKRKDYVKQ